LQHYQHAAEFLTKARATAQEKIETYTGLGSVQSRLRCTAFWLPR
jgi:hypothetical protein